MIEVERELIIRADANTEMGSGHLMRCLALAQVWKDNKGKVTLLTTCDNDNLLDRYRKENIEIIKLEYAYPAPQDWQSTSQILASQPDSWVVLDGYHFNHNYQLLIINTDNKLLVVDDLGNLERYSADIILNQNLYATQLDYSFENKPILLFGPEFALLRREFWKWKNWERKCPNIANNVLITMGGSDPENQTLRVIQALKELNNDALSINVVLGASNPNINKIRKEIKNSDIEFSLKFDVSNMSDLMAWADIAITAGGVTCYEIAFMRLPSLVISLADNQKGTAAYMDKIGAAVNLGWYKDIEKTDLKNSINKLISDPKLRKEISGNAYKLVDGKGVSRVIDHMYTPGEEPIYQVRSGTREDNEMLWTWANDPAVRNNSFNSNPIPLEDHNLWFEEKLNSSKTVIYIIERNSIPVAQVRYDSISETEAEVDFSVVKEYRGYGIGTVALRITFEEACNHLQIGRVQGIALESNEASQRVFIKAGYQNNGQKNIKSKNSVVFTKVLDTGTGEIL